MHLHVEVQEQHQDRAVQHRVEHPRADPVAPALGQVQRQNADVAHQVAPQEHDLAVRDEREARDGQPDGGPEAVPVHGGVDERGREDGEDLERLRVLEPEEGDASEGGVVEELRGGEAAAAEDGEEGAEHVEEAGEVEGVGPEEDAAGGAGAEREAEEPLERRRPGAAPQPLGIADLGGGGEEGPREDSGGEEGHEEAVEGRGGADGDGASAQEEEEEEVEKEGEGEVEGDGGDEEGPCGAPRLGVAPPEVDDRRVLGEVVRQPVRRHGHHRRSRVYRGRLINLFDSDEKLGKRGSALASAATLNSQNALQGFRIWVLDYFRERKAGRAWGGLNLGGASMGLLLRGRDGRLVGMKCW
ncbi:Hexosyltransferase [Psidium guajava]|nr:Hexosyltransferase [Psidium guajava]